MFIFVTEHWHVVQGIVVIEILPVYYMIQVEHDEDANHTMAVEKICQATVSSKSFF